MGLVARPQSYGEVFGSAHRRMAASGTSELGVIL